MFTGIIETLGIVEKLRAAQSNLHITVKSGLAAELKIDQSLAHNGVCLTVVSQKPDAGTHTVTAILETLEKSSLGGLKVGDKLNLERCLTPSARLDGHFVQGHVDDTAICTNIRNANGSWYFTFGYNPIASGNVLVNKGSICIDGVSLTVVNPSDTEFSVAIIPYTYENTLFHTYKVGSTVNLEYDIIGKYIAKLFERRM